ncbi:VOC family protein [Bradyrhizobium guangdongense]|uniref:VOC family protein n=1 Tax=Bradyrhizobium guangdongense TaxID=1325090 RepID=UPI00131A29DB|nr:VOC family protein [Bradyrhizobium guangdongense]
MALTIDAVKPVLDHVVINVAAKLDEAAAQYSRLGFHLTERGHHSLGSSNNLAIFGENYLELLGYLPGNETKRADLWAHPPGLTGLVFKSVDPDLVFAALRERGVSAEQPMSFSRPVSLPDGAQDARFRVVRVGGEAVQNGRTFFCHHDTPELVYRPEWRAHPNGAIDIVEFVIAAKAPSRTAALYERMFGVPLLSEVPGGVSFRAGLATVRVLEPSAIVERYAGAALVSEDGSDRMVALVFKVASLDAPRAVFEKAGIDYRPYADGIVVSHADAANVALGFAAS